MANNRQTFLLFGHHISKASQEQEQQEGGGGGGLGCYSTSMEMPVTENINHIINYHGGSDFSLDLTKQQHIGTSSSSSSNISYNINGHINMATQKLIHATKVVHNPTIGANIKLFIEMQQQQEQQMQANMVRLVASRIGRFRHYRPWEEEEERRRGVSTRLELYSDPWKVKKKLTMSDVSTMSRVLLHAYSVDIHVKPFMVRAGFFNQVETSQGVRVSVWDVETNTLHKLVFKQWESSRSFILIGNWRREFVRRRRLKEGDEIGFLWDPYYSRFLFRVLNRAPI